MKTEGIQTLTADDVLQIHELLIRDFAKSNDPIEPSGLRERGLLESAVGRQFTALGNTLKYETPIVNAATLCYGVCANHPFYNGNKRTALVSLLCHLDKNGYTFRDDVDQQDLYRFMITVADHGFAPKRPQANASDIEVEEMAHWIRRGTRHVDKSERVVTYRELRRILRQYDIELDHPKGNYIDVIKYEWKRKHLFAPKERVGARIAHIPYPGEGTVVGKGLLKSLRKTCKLTEQDGIDSEIFYAGERPADFFIMKYKKALRKLARV